MSEHARSPQPSVHGGKSTKSVTSRHSSELSHRSSVLVRKRAKAEAAKASLQFAVQEAELRKKQALVAHKEQISAAESARVQAEIDADLNLLQTQKHVAETEAEFQIFQQSSVGDNGTYIIDLPLEAASVRTEKYVADHDTPVSPSLFSSPVDEVQITPKPETRPTYLDSTKPDSSLSISNAPSEHAADNIHSNEKTKSNFTSTPHFAQRKITLNPTVTPFVPVASDPVTYGRQSYPTQQTMNTEFTQYLLKKDLLTTRLSNFDDKPESFAMWKSGFCSIVRELGVTASEEIDLLVKWLGNESRRHAISLRFANANNPIKGLHRIWDRLDERYGSAEMVEAALKSKLDHFPRLTNKDNDKLYDLSDILGEIQSVKEDPKYATLLGYFDSSSGVRPILNKLPYNIQEKWTNHAARYKKEHRIAFPPFHVLCEFIQELSHVRNDPSLVYEYMPLPKQDKMSPKQAFNKREFYSKKTGVDEHQKDVAKSTPVCPLHKTSHSPNDCRSFRSKTVEDRKQFLKDHDISYRCCDSTDHVSRNCKMNISCSLCNSDKHVAALHIERNSARSPPSIENGGEKFDSTTLTAHPKCTQVCGDRFDGKSCSKTILTKVYPTGHPEQSIMAYVILDDQSNVTLGRSTFFDRFHENGTRIPYNLSSCAGVRQTFGRRASGYTVESLDGINKLNIPKLIECDDIPNVRQEIPTPDIARQYPHLRDLASIIPVVDNNAEILLLIGRDVPEAHHVLEQRTGAYGSPFAQRLQLGWVIIGETCIGKVHKRATANVNKIYMLPEGRPSNFPPCDNKFDVHELKINDNIGGNVFQLTKHDHKLGMSAEDKQFLKIMDSEMHLSPEGNWVAPLPFKANRQRLPNNKSEAAKRARTLHHSLVNNPTKRQHFVEFMRKVIENNHAEKAPPLKEGEECWYLPLFGVYHSQKPGQIRGVFDSSASHEGVSLNDVLLKGPDLTNSLLGVLLRFRQDKVAFTADIQSMFHCFLVREDHRNFLRFLWYAENDPNNKLVDYRMRVHVFGNRPSPAVATYGLLKACQAGQNDTHNTQDVTNFVERNFYVDDGLASCPTDSEAIDLLRRTQDALQKGGNLRLHKIASNSQTVMKAFPAEDYANNFKDLNFDKDDLPEQRSLGLIWDLQADIFTFHVSSAAKPFTRRGVLSVINSLFDPIGFAAPILIRGKLLLRDLMTETVDWDEPLSLNRQREWDEWRESLEDLEHLKVQRTYTSVSGDTAQKEVLVFSDASETSIAVVSYMRTTDDTGNSHVGFILGKAKVAPKHGHTIPRLELCAAVLATEIAETISEHLDVPLSEIRYFTDSKVLLGYLYNQTRRFYIYVANRVERIQKSSSPQQWAYVPSQSNPADVATRAIIARDLGPSAWLQGPSKIAQWERHDCDVLIPPDPETDKEVRRTANVKTTKVIGTDHLGTERFTRFSSWKCLVEAIARLQNVVQTFKGQNGCGGWHTCASSKTVQCFKDAQLLILREIQNEVYSSEIHCIKTNQPLHRDSPILALDPVLDENGLLTVGGRLKRSDLPIEGKHPIILPGKHHVSTLLVRHHHELIEHQGRLFTEGAVRAAGFWITGCKRLINSTLYKCVKCRKRRGQPCEQNMSDLPVDRLSPAPPFTYVGVDTFGPWNVVTRKTRGGSANSKRWAILFTCMTVRAIHIEVVEEMTSSSFINALKRFQSLRGKVIQYRSDRGTNFVGATDSLGIDVINVEDPPVKTFLYNSGVQWIFNPPHSPHMGGSWERMIGITRRILDSIMSDMSSKNMTHEVLVTFMSEVCAIVNNRPIVPVSSDPESPFILSPNLLLTQKTGSSVEPLRQCDMGDLYRAQWKRVQVLAEQFWRRWRTEYIHSLQVRRKWKQDRPSVEEGDVVVLKEKDTPRNEWPLGIITQALPGSDGRIRKAVIRVSKPEGPVTYTRPISEIVILLQ